jgi:predicted RecA/RadA family phage recombinase
MKNYVQQGNAVYAPAPAGGVHSGDLVVIGALFGVAGFDAAVGVPVPLHNDGIFSLPKLAGTAWTVGVPIYCANVAHNDTIVVGTNVKIGVATALAPSYTAAAASADTVGDVRLNRSF